MKKEKNLTVFGVGYNSGAISHSNGVALKSYKIWISMLQRCYSERFKEIYKYSDDYDGVTVCDEWKDYKNFKKWYEDNYYEVEGERIHLDKDILVKGNKIYSPDTCIFVPEKINVLFTKRDSKRGKSVIGTTPKNGKYAVYCHMINPKTGKSKQEFLGCYETQEKAFEIYKYYKEKNIKEVADYFKGKIPQKLHNTLYKYEVEITD